jgi:hypothetical protein
MYEQREAKRRGVVGQARRIQREKTWRVISGALSSRAFTFVFVVVSYGGRVMFALVGDLSRQCSHGILYAHKDIQILHYQRIVLSSARMRVSVISWKSEESQCLVAPSRPLATKPAGIEASFLGESAACL